MQKSKLDTMMTHVAEQFRYYYTCMINSHLSKQKL